MNAQRTDRILLGITGGIAAYKTGELTRQLIAQGCEVDVVMTAAAREFITPVTLQALSGRPVTNASSGRPTSRRMAANSASISARWVTIDRWASNIRRVNRS